MVALMGHQASVVNAGTATVNVRHNFPATGYTVLAFRC